MDVKDEIWVICVLKYVAFIDQNTEFSAFLF